MGNEYYTVKPGFLKSNRASIARLTSDSFFGLVSIRNRLDHARKQLDLAAGVELPGETMTSPWQAHRRDREVIVGSRCKFAFARLFSLNR
jgi:hypothetical protein